MNDLAISLENRPGALATMGEVLGEAGISIEGGGGFVVAGRGLAHLLFGNGDAAREVLEAHGILVIDVRRVLVQRLRQDRPGQLGSFARRLADADINIETVYSDHNNRLIVVVDDFERGRAVSERWTREIETACTRW